MKFKYRKIALALMMLSGCAFYSSSANGADASNNPSPQLFSDQLFNQEQQRQQALQRRLQPNVNVRAAQPTTQNPNQTLPIDETPCFAIQEVSLVGNSARRFQFVLDNALRWAHFHSGMCLGGQSVNLIMTLAQNQVIEHGYTTTRIVAKTQDLSTGKLELTVIPGRIHAIDYDATNKAQTHVGRITVWRNQLATRAGDILNLRDLEQTLENLKRNPTADASFKIVPADIADESDILIHWQQRTIPYRMMFSLDDSGSKETGRYQGGITFAADNPLGLSDLFYANYTRNLSTTDRKYADDGSRIDGKTQSYALHYSVPFGHWEVGVNHSFYRYHQPVAGYETNYDYQGETYNTDFDLTRLLYRNSNSKTYLTGKLWQRESHNYIDDAEVDVQERKTGGWAINLDHTHYFGASTLDVNLGYKRGTGLFQSQRFPEEAYDEGTSRMQIITSDISLYSPFRIADKQFSYDGTFHGQWNKTPLINQDKLAIGGRYSVRGFDGELSLMGNRGWYLQNNLAWHFEPTHQIYLGADVGHVSGPTTKYQVGQTLAGAVVGLKGQFKIGGHLSYDLFAGKPIYKPTGFQTANTAVGFALNYRF